MHAIIPVAGFGTRLRPHTYSRPKVLLNVAGKPILGHILDQVIADGITSATVIVGYMGDTIEKFVVDTYPNLKVNFVEQTELLGLGHAIWMAREYIPVDGSPLFIVLGDTIFETDLASTFKLSNSAIGVFHVDDPRRFGVVETEHGFVTRLVEKPEHPKTNLMIAGLYYFRNPKLLKACLEELVDKDIRTKNEYQLTDALQMMVERGEKFATFPLTGWFDCGKPDTLLSTNRALLGKSTSSVPDIPNTIINPPVFIGEGAVLTNCVIGPNATIGPGATVENSIVRDSIIGDRARLDRVLLESSIIGNDAVISSAFHRMSAGDYAEVLLH